MARTAVLSWDWTEQIPIGDLARAVLELSDGRVRITEVDTGTDQHAVVISDRRLDAAAARLIYDESTGWGAP